MAISNEHSGWKNRGYLPHYDKPGLIQAVTFRLADSLPKEKRLEWEHLLQITDDGERIRQIEDYLDRGAGLCVLRQSECASIVQNALLHFDGERYRLIAWCVMPSCPRSIPNLCRSSHRQSHPFVEDLHAREINKRLNQSGQLWQNDFFDTFMRDDEHHAAEVLYIERNPVKANLVKRSIDWPWSSATRSASMA